MLKESQGVCIAHSNKINSNIADLLSCLYFHRVLAVKFDLKRALVIHVQCASDVAAKDI